MPAHALELTNPETGPLDMLFHFEHMSLDHDPSGPAGWGWRPWELQALKEVTTRWQEALEGRGWISQFFSNHDQPRQVSRFGDDGRYRVESAKLLGTFLHMLHGTPCIYQGEEIGMTSVAFDSIEDYRDILTINHYRRMVEEERVDRETAMELVHKRSRDNARTPLQWDASESAGFTSGAPWITINPNYPEINVEQALADLESIFYYYRELIRLRKSNPVIVDGLYRLILADHPEIYAFTRTLGDERLLVILNFTACEPVFELPETVPTAGHELLIANYPLDDAEDIHRIVLKPYEARVYRLR
jgi:oligo-1,6-glucosidase